MFALPAALYFWSYAPLQASAALYINLWALSVVDWQTFRLPNLFSGTLVVTGLYATWVLAPFEIEGHLIGMLAGGLFPLCVNATYRALRGKDGMGIGDAKLLAGGGAWLGWEALPVVLLIASVTALVYRIDTKDDQRSKWAQQLLLRAGHNKTLVAMANKTARIAWTILRNGEEYKTAQ